MWDNPRLLNIAANILIAAALAILGGTGVYSAAQICCRYRIARRSKLCKVAAKDGFGAASFRFVCRQFGLSQLCKPAKDIGKAMKKRLCK